VDDSRGIVLSIDPRLEASLANDASNRITEHKNIVWREPKGDNTNFGAI